MENKKTLLIIVIALLIFIIIASGFGLYFIINSNAEKEDLLKVDKKIIMYSFEDSFISNVKDSKRILKITIKVELANSKIEDIITARNPEIRNEIAHTGLIETDNLEHLANELILDLNTVISWIYEISHEKYKILMMISDALDNKKSEDINVMASTLIYEMVSCMSIADFKYLDLLKKPSDYLDEIGCMKTPMGYWDTIIDKIMNIIKTETFWSIIDEHIDETENFETNKPFNLLVLADKLKNTFIPILDKDSPEKLACQRVAAKIHEMKQR